jgi:hypothetical protein
MAKISKIRWKTYLSLALGLSLWVIGCLYPTPSRPHYDSGRQITSGWSGWIAHANWLRFFSTVPEDDPKNMVIRIERICRLDPKNYFFIINGVGLLGYDLPAGLPDSESKVWVDRAVLLLDEALIRRPGDPFYHYELGKLYLLKRNDPERAKHHFTLASQSK